MAFRSVDRQSLGMAQETWLTTVRAVERPVTGLLDTSISRVAKTTRLRKHHIPTFDTNCDYDCLFVRALFITKKLFGKGATRPSNVDSIALQGLDNAHW